MNKRLSQHAPQVESGTTIAAFSEEHAARLTGLTMAQLRRWDVTGFYRPSYAHQNRRMPFSRVYSFRDIAALRVISVLKNQFQVSLQHLRKVGERLSHLGENCWVGVKLYAINRRVVWYEEGSEKPREVVSGQYVVSVVLEHVIRETKLDIERLNERGEADIGKIEQRRYINHNAKVLAGTRIPVVAIQRFAAAGYDVAGILDEYPDLTKSDVEAALAYKRLAA